LIGRKVTDVLLQLPLGSLLARLAFGHDDGLVVICKDVNLLSNCNALIACYFDLETAADI
jgi:hypothetical protein